MKAISRVLDIMLYIIIFITLISSVGSAVTKKPFLLTAVRSNSMYPVFQRGDMLFISPVNINSKLNINDIIIFDPEEGSLKNQGVIAHRIVGGNEIEGYITKGDANKDIDQSYKGDSPIKKEWISGRVITIGKTPIKIPLLGYIPLWMEKFQKSPYLLPAIAVILAIIIGAGELTKSKKKSSKKSNLTMPLIYFFSGLAVSVMLAASMISMSQHLKLVYQVTESDKGIIMGSDVGILKVGEVVEKPLSELKNKGFFPMISTTTSSDSQISFSHDSVLLGSNNEIRTTYRVEALTPGKYESVIDVGMFLPILPTGVIYALAKQSYWLALAVVALIPGLPIMLYPVLNSKLRRKAFKEIKYKFRRLRLALVMG